MNPFQAIINWFQKTWQNSINSIKNGGFMAGDPVVLYAPPGNAIYTQPYAPPPYGPPGGGLLTTEEMAPGYKATQNTGNYTNPSSYYERPSIQRPNPLSRLGKALLPAPVDTMPYTQSAIEHTSATESTQIHNYNVSRIADPSKRTRMTPGKKVRGLGLPVSREHPMLALHRSKHGKLYSLPFRKEHIPHPRPTAKPPQPKHAPGHGQAHM